MKLMWLGYVDKVTAAALGVVIIPVFDDEIAAARKRLAELHPKWTGESDVLFAAIKKVREIGVAPGQPDTTNVEGEQVDPDKVPVDMIGRLLTRAELVERNMVDPNVPA